MGFAIKKMCKTNDKLGNFNRIGDQGIDVFELKIKNEHQWKLMDQKEHLSDYVL